MLINQTEIGDKFEVDEGVIKITHSRIRKDMIEVTVDPAKI